MHARLLRVEVDPGGDEHDARQRLDELGLRVDLIVWVEGVGEHGEGEVAAGGVACYDDLD